MRLWEKYRLRLRRQRLRVRAVRKRRELTLLRLHPRGLAQARVVLAMTVRNERIRLPYFLDYYRRLGIDHFIVVDNGSDDGSAAYLADQPDVSLWHAGASYAGARFGMDWLNWLLSRYCHDRWVLVVDVDEFLIFPFCDSRPVDALTDWLDNNGRRSFSAMLVDMYPKGAVGDLTYAEGQNPFEIADWFDGGNYMISRNATYGNLWIQGGPRARHFFADQPEQAPSLNKIPLVRWDRRNVFVHSTHMLLPRGLNLVYATDGGEMASGCLLHAKFLSVFPAKVSEELRRQEHFSDSQEYRAYANGNPGQANLWCKWSENYINWRQMEILGLMSRGNWA